jgi:hypothetical protein
MVCVRALLQAAALAAVLALLLAQVEVVLASLLLRFVWGLAQVLARSAPISVLVCAGASFEPLQVEELEHGPSAPACHQWLVEEWHTHRLATLLSR